MHKHHSIAAARAVRLPTAYALRAAVALAPASHDAWRYCRRGTGTLQREAATEHNHGRRL